MIAEFAIRAALVFVLLLVEGCAMFPLAEPISELPILSVDDGKSVTRQDLVDQMRSARVIYLGEKHDNPEHHRLQMHIIQDLVKAGRRPALGFEFFTRAQTSWLQDFSVGVPSPMGRSGAENSLDRDGEVLRERLGWKDRSEWAFYYPMLVWARQQKLSIFGADLPRGLRFRLTRVGLEGLSPVERHLIPSTGFVHEDYRQLMLKQLSDAHCGVAPPALLDRLYATWVARNDTMATSITLLLKELPVTEPVVMILGAGHVAHGMGVMDRVAHLNPGLRQFNLGFKEVSVSPSEADLARYRQPVVVGKTRFLPEHAYLWLTPPAPAADTPDEDPCAAFRRMHSPRSGADSSS
ncbi:MAG: ChaN family lipoprotein [Magnetococcales bacterium]|nr:ChaN family lipoprotein [Magnetococcales bacterium]